LIVSALNFSHEINVAQKYPYTFQLWLGHGKRLDGG